MPDRCVVGGCSNVRKAGRMTLFKWPTDPSISSKWTRFVLQTRVGFTPTKWSKICQAHFVKDDIEGWMKHAHGVGILQLKDKAIPTIRCEVHGG